MNFNDLKVKIFADGAEISAMKKLHSEGFISGFTTNPSLMKKAGIGTKIMFGLLMRPLNLVK